MQTKLRKQYDKSQSIHNHLIMKKQNCFIIDNSHKHITNQTLTRKICDNTSNGVIIQRLYGFEAELPVPTMKGNNLTGFLSGGMKYGKPLGKTSGFKMFTDHGNFMEVHKKIVDIIKKKKKPKEYSDLKIKPISNLEYVTDPIDEFGTDSDKTFNNQFSEISEHAKQIFTFVKEKIAKIPNTNVFTGLPYNDLAKELGKDGITILDEYKKLIKPEFYIQATAGIIQPSLVIYGIKQMI